MTILKYEKKIEPQNHDEFKLEIEKAVPPQKKQNQNTVDNKNAQEKKSQTLSEKNITDEKTDFAETEENEISETGISDNAETGDAGILKNIAEEKNELNNSYKKYVLEKISSKKIYPVTCRMENQTGKVRLHIIILPNGNLKEVEIIQACEHKLLNEAAVKAVKKSAPFKKMKNQTEPLDFSFLMDFSLE